ncbi:MAG: tetraacyldisaccharide 4'-kinase, partial [Neisseriaceae bacterium]|nr:tetraacyldisaccharide 4'-kinase [Neisseriaceae bacterium]
MSLLTQIIERHWQKPIFGLTLVLRPLSWLFGAVVKMRRSGYRLAYFKSECLPVSVVVVGNIHVGGSGKTPFVAALVKGLQNQDIKVGI